MTSPIDLTALRALAEQATAGRWTAKVYAIEEAEEEVGYAAYLRTHEHNGDYDAEETARDDAEADARYIAAASPDVVLALIERVERSERKAETFQRDWYDAKSEFGTAMAKRAEAVRAAERRELAALAELDEARATLRAIAELPYDGGRATAAIAMQNMAWQALKGSDP